MFCSWSFLRRARGIVLQYLRAPVMPVLLPSSTSSSCVAHSRRTAAGIRAFRITLLQSPLSSANKSSSLLSFPFKDRVPCIELASLLTLNAEVLEVALEVALELVLEVVRSPSPFALRAVAPISEAIAFVLPSLVFASDAFKTLINSSGSARMVLSVESRVDTNDRFLLSCATTGRGCMSVDDNRFCIILTGRCLEGGTILPIIACFERNKECAILSL
mmetsp:Transcript_69952/g.113566  ORF Transcript_69952/g.113566 Transcript_69952/m.113566 type:complete len:218 (+) Transcript_69952:1029-1682(+)